jgi:hypothetical protein
LVFSSMPLGVPFIAPRQLGVVESNSGRQFLPSVAWRTGQSGADFLPYLAKPTVASLGAVGASDTVRCTPDSPVNYSRTPLITSRERLVRLSQPGAPDTVRCTTGQSGAPRLSRVLAARAKTFLIVLLLFPALRHNTLVTKTMY